MINILIPAAGKGKRSKLNYPKTLYEINGTPILISLINTILTSKIKFINITIISSPEGYSMIKKTLVKYKVYKYCEIIIQPKANGMGDAILMFQNSRYYDSSNKILLIWGDIPFPSSRTLNNLIKYNQINNDVISFPIRYVKNPYTIVNMKNSKPTSISETKHMVRKKKSGFREVGMFVFKKNIVFEYLNKNYKVKKDKSSYEHGFLYIIKILYMNNFKIGAYNIASKMDLISFNKMDDLKDSNL